MTLSSHRSPTSAAGSDIEVVRGRLRSTNPMPDSEPNDAERSRSAATFDAISAAIAREDHSASSDTSAPSPTRGFRIGRAIQIWRPAAAAITIAVAALLASNFLFEDNAAIASPMLPRPLLTVTSGDHPSAVQLLGDAASAAESAEWGNGSALHTNLSIYGLETAVKTGLSTTVARIRVRDTWYRPDGTVQVQERNQNIDRAGGDVGGPTPPIDDDLSGTYSAGDFPDPALELPASPSELLVYVRQALKSSDNVDVAVDLMALIQVGTTSPLQNAAFYRVLAGIPQVFDAGAVTDRAGRNGRAVGVVEKSSGGFAEVTYLVLDIKTGRPLDVESVDTPGPPPGLKLPAAPTVEAYTQINESEHVSASRAGS